MFVANLRYLTFFFYNVEQTTPAIRAADLHQQTITLNSIEYTSCESNAQLSSSDVIVVLQEFTRLTGNTLAYNNTASH